MPKVAKKFRAKPEPFATEFGSDVFSTDGSVLLSKTCERDVTAERKSQLTEHLDGLKHKSKVERRRQSASNVVQINSYLQASGKQSQFSLDLCNAFRHSSVPVGRCKIHEKSSEDSESYVSKNGSCQVCGSSVT